jgi:hypothetical protein
MSRFVVAITRTSTSISRWLPSGVTLRSCKTRSNFACSDNGISEISSNNNVPPSAARKMPLFAVDAPVN